MRTVLTPDQERLAQQVAKDLGARFKAARLAARERQIDVARRLRVEQTTLSAFERGQYINCKLGNAIRILSAYQISIIAVTQSRNASRLEAAS